MKLAIFGATGGTGRALVEQALAAGHEVTALVRDPARVTVQNPRVHLVQGNSPRQQPRAGGGGQ